MSDSRSPAPGRRPVAMIAALGVIAAILVTMLIIALVVRTPRPGTSLPSGVSPSAASTTP